MKLLLSLALLLAFLLSPAACAEGVRNGLRLAAQQAIPALFPFFVAGNLLVRSGAAASLSRLAARPLAWLYRLPPAAASAVILGLLGGYPVGASAVAALLEQKQLDCPAAERVLSFCNCTSPGFCIALCGLAVCGNAQIGAMLYGVHIVATLLVGLITARKTRSSSSLTISHLFPCFSFFPTHPPQPTVSFSAPASSCPPQDAPPPCDTSPNTPRSSESFAAAFCNAVQDAAKTAVTVTAFLTLFSVILALLAPIWETIPYAAVFIGLLELTNGLNALITYSIPAGLLLPFLSFLLGFGGLAVHFQVRAVLAAYPLSFRRFTLGKLLHGSLAAALTWFVCWLCPTIMPVSAPIHTPVFSAIAPIGLEILGNSLLLGIVLILSLFWGGKRAKNTL